MADWHVDDLGLSAPDYGRSLRGLGINLLVRAIRPQLEFQAEVLGATIVRADDSFAVLRFGEAEWMLHVDESYHQNPLLGHVRGARVRGAGCELRLYGRDPDVAEAACRELGCTVLQPAATKPHGLREAFLLCPDGYCWVPGAPVA